MTSGSRLSAVARRTGPARQRAAAAWPPRAASTARVKALSGRRRVPTAHPAPPDRCLAALACSARPLPRVRRRLPDQPCPRAPVRRCHAPRSEPSRRRLRRREFLHGERRPTASPHRSSPVELELSLLAVTRPPPATVAPPHRGDAAAEPDFFSSPSTRSSGELACRPSCPAGSLTVMGAPPPLLASSPPLCAWAEPTPRAWATHTVRLGRARIRPSAPG
jgi:hypothetical protein